ncbi:Ribonuclease HII [Anaerolineales bacterium]|nr:Ribonuclease HII [Anaerolineales bacterium]
MRCAVGMTSPPDLFYENNLWFSWQYLAGLDEAGRGALAGPVCVGAVILPHDSPLLLQTLSGVRDSKQLTPRRREKLVPCIKQVALAWGIGFASAVEIDELGIVPATRLAANRVLEAMPILPDFLLTDFRLELPELDLPQAALVKGDQRSLSIASASVLAKTARDALMIEQDVRFPQYGFAHHKGYGSLAHRLAIAKFGFSPIHRKTFRIKSGNT